LPPLPAPPPALLPAPPPALLPAPPPVLFLPPLPAAALFLPPPPALFLPAPPDAVLFLPAPPDAALFLPAPPDAALFLPAPPDAALFLPPPAALFLPAPPDAALFLPPLLPVPAAPTLFAPVLFFFLENLVLIFLDTLPAMDENLFLMLLLFTFLNAVVSLPKILPPPRIFLLCFSFIARDFLFNRIFFFLEYLDFIIIYKYKKNNSIKNYTIYYLMCGIYLIVSLNKLVTINNVLENLKKIQHRGQDAVGIMYKNKDSFSTITKNGAIQTINDKIESNIYMTHLRYKTSGNSTSKGLQPITAKSNLGEFSFVFNGNIPLKKYSYIFKTEFILDTDLIKYFLIKEATLHNSWEEVLCSFMNTFERAYNLIIITNNDIYVIKDRYGVRPLSYYVSESTDTLEICSETVGLTTSNNDKEIKDQINYNEIKEGTIAKYSIDFSEKTITKYDVYDFFYNKDELYDSRIGGRCIFEHVYFASPNSVWNNVKTDELRKKWAITLAKEDLDEGYFKEDMLNTSCDTLVSDTIVIGIPSTGIIPGQEYARHCNLNYSQAIIKNKDVKRTFILPENIRDTISKKKYIYDKEKIQGKKIIILDDSIVRGVTIKNIVTSLHEAGASEIHIRITSPPIKDICMYGIDIPTKDELISNTMSINDINSHLGSNSLRFLNIDDMLLWVDEPSKYCTGCFNSNYNELKHPNSSYNIPPSYNLLKMVGLDW
jgi:amidophosphoribosyltransferase